MTGAAFWQLAISLAGGLLSGAASVVWLELWYKPPARMPVRGGAVGYGY
jgi:hypothetical protein